MNAPDLEACLGVSAPRAFAGTPVLFAYLFGSHATGHSGPASDVDVAVFVDPSTPSERSLELSLDLAGRLADASSLPRIEVVVMNGAPLALLGSILRDRRIVFTCDEPARVRFEATTRSAFMDFDIHARRMDRELLRRTADGTR